ncbi:MAG: hypothetical protein K6E36_06525 [Oscillospiraceae bacterium]|nr:hypothetical protein [Oscillospiraceae bacterium]
MKQIALLLAVTILLTGCGCSAPEPADITERSSASVTQTAESTESADVTRTVEAKPDSTAEAQNNETTVPTETERTTAAADNSVSGSPANTGTQRNAGSAEARNTTAAGTSQTATSKTTPKVTTNTTRGTITTNKTTTTTTTKKNNGSEPEIDGYKLSEVLTERWAFGSFVYQLNIDLGYVPGKLLYSGVRFSYGQTGGGTESQILFYLLNSDYIELFDKNSFGDIVRFGKGTLERGKEFCSKYKYIITTLGTSVDFTQYTLNHDLAVLLNKIVDSGNKGTLSQLTIPKKYKDHPAVKTLLHSYGVYKNDDYMDSFLDELSTITFGEPYITNSKTYTK